MGKNKVQEKKKIMNINCIHLKNETWPAKIKEAKRAAPTLLLILSIRTPPVIELNGFFKKGKKEKEKKEKKKKYQE